MNEKITLGISNANEAIHWHYNQIANNHLTITGVTGSGKTYASLEYARQVSNVGISSLIIDYSNSFSIDMLPHSFTRSIGKQLNYHNVYTNGLPFNPLIQGTITCNHVTILEKPVDTASRIADMFQGAFQLNTQQYGRLYFHLCNGLNAHYHDGTNFDFNTLCDLITEDKNSSAQSLLNKARILFDHNIFNADDAFTWADFIYCNGSITVLQLNNFNEYLQKIITDLVISSLWNYTYTHGSIEKPFVVIFDECQKINSKGNAPIKKVLTEGRKFGWSAWFITQILMGSSELEMQKLLMMPSTQIYFKPVDKDIRHIAKHLDSTSMSLWTNRLQHLQRGECVIKTPIPTITGLSYIDTPILANVRGE